MDIIGLGTAPSAVRHAIRSALDANPALAAQAVSIIRAADGRVETTFDVIDVRTFSDLMKSLLAGDAMTLGPGTYEWEGSILLHPGDGLPDFVFPAGVTIKSSIPRAATIKYVKPLPTWRVPGAGEWKVPNYTATGIISMFVCHSQGIDFTTGGLNALRAAIPSICLQDLVLDINAGANIALDNAADNFKYWRPTETADQSEMVWPCRGANPQYDLLNYAIKESITNCRIVGWTAGGCQQFDGTTADQWTNPDYFTQREHFPVYLGFFGTLTDCLIEEPYNVGLGYGPAAEVYPATSTTEVVGVAGVTAQVIKAMVLLGGGSDSYSTIGGLMVVTVTGTASGLPVTVEVPVEESDTNLTVAAKIRTALAIPAITGHFNIDPTADNYVKLTANTARANDTTLLLSIAGLLYTDNQHYGMYCTVVQTNPGCVCSNNLIVFPASITVKGKGGIDLDRPQYWRDLYTRWISDNGQPAKYSNACFGYGLAVQQYDASQSPVILDNCRAIRVRRVFHRDTGSTSNVAITGGGGICIYGLAMDLWTQSGLPAVVRNIRMSNADFELHDIYQGLWARLVGLGGGYNLEEEGGPGFGYEHGVFVSMAGYGTLLDGLMVENCTFHTEWTYPVGGTQQFRNVSVNGHPNELTAAAAEIVTFDTIPATVRNVTLRNNSVQCYNPESFLSARTNWNGSAYAHRYISPAYYDSNPSALGEDWSGTTITGFAGETLVYGQLAYYDGANGWWSKADASAYGTCAAVQLGICLAAGSVSDVISLLLSGSIISSGFWSPTTGAELWVSDVPGEYADVQVTGTGKIVRRIGYTLADATSQLVIVFSPSNSWTIL